MKLLSVWMLRKHREKQRDASLTSRFPIYFSFPSPSRYHCDIANMSRRTLLAFFSTRSPFGCSSESPLDTSGKLKHMLKWFAQERALATYASERESGVSFPTGEAHPFKWLHHLVCSSPAQRGLIGGFCCNSALRRRKTHRISPLREGLAIWTRLGHLCKRTHSSSSQECG